MVFCSNMRIFLFLILPTFLSTYCTTFLLMTFLLTKMMKMSCLIFLLLAAVE